MFYSSAISAVILVFRYSRTDNAVLFIDASREFTPGRRLNSFRDEDIERLVSVFRQRTQERGYSRLVTRVEIEANDFNLNVSRYLDNTERQPTFDMNAFAKEAEELGELGELGAELEILRHEINTALRNLLHGG